ncbi:SapB/AmfS family lantipeptide [Streptomyces sp. SID13666]|nr:MULTISPECIES: SapB/AmfS family lanthipeptide [unclassified Streptomyces]MCM2428651.1 SapB/AmfS family lanthipeptide [Streptomyces sp. RKAG337]NEA56761.1 SapB/AmfS family lantipeptide [Streptomyces sp. SID13666]NEA75008.1 SapB/AmfS family lantipeptide [Streptomyces sp. SID13588]
MALLDLQSLEIPQGHGGGGGGGGDLSTASLLLCDTNSHGSVLLCL